MESKYRIPRQTIQFRLSNNLKKIEYRHRTYLTTQEENKIVKWIVDSREKEFSRREIDIQYSVKPFLKTDRRKDLYKNNVPGNYWFKLFLNRHSILLVPLKV